MKVFPFSLVILFKALGINGYTCTKIFIFQSTMYQKEYLGFRDTEVGLITNSYTLL